MVGGGSEDGGGGRVRMAERGGRVRMFFGGGVRMTMWKSWCLPSLWTQDRILIRSSDLQFSDINLTLRVFLWVLLKVQSKFWRTDF